MSPLRALLACLLVAALSGAAAAQPTPSDPTKSLSPYFFIEGGDPDVDPLPLEDTAVSIQVTGVIADVTVRQTYSNQGARPINARYVFPASTRAAVHGMKMTIGSDVIEAVVKERQEARAEFEQAKREGKNAALLEEERPNVFGMDVANIMPGDRVLVELRYTELVVPTDGVYELVYPTVVGPRYGGLSAGQPYTHAGTAPKSKLSIDAQVTSGIPIQEMSVPSHAAAAVKWAGAARTEGRVSLPAGPGGDRDFILRYRLAGSKIQSGLLLQRGKHETFFLLMVEPPARVSPAEVPPREYVFIVDVSGSMHGFPLDTTKVLLRKLTSGMRPQDSFNVILFSGSHQLMAPRSVPATPENVERAMRVIDDERGGGGTELLPALQEAMALPSLPGVSRAFVVITDGYISTEKAIFQYVRKHLGQASVFAFGIGSSVNRYLIEGVAKAGLGEPFIVTDETGAAAAAAKFQTYIETPVLTDITVSYDGFRAYDVEPVAIADLLAQRPLVIHGKWVGDPQGKITVTGLGGAGRYTHVEEVSRVTPTQSQVLSYLWARTRIAFLSDFSSGDESDEEKAEITQLGLSYNLLTRHTSFIAVRHRVVNAGAPAADVDQPLPLPAGVSDYAVGMEAGSEPGLLVMLLVFGLVGVAAWMGRARGRRVGAR